MSDFVGGIASRRVAAIRVVLVSYPVAMVLLTVLALIAGGHLSSGALLWGSLTGFAQAFGVWWFYAALAGGPMSVVSPLTSMLVSGIPVGIGLAMGERFSVLAGFGIVAAVVSVFLVSRQVSDADSTPHRFTPAVAWLTIGAGCAFGLNFFLIHQAPHDAKLWPLVIARAVASVMVLLIAIAGGEARIPSGFSLRLALTAACLDVAANTALLIALHSSLLSLGSVLVSLYPAVTVLLAVAVLKERVTRWQVLGMALAIAAIAMIAAD